MASATITVVPADTVMFEIHCGNCDNLLGRGTVPQIQSCNTDEAKCECGYIGARNLRLIEGEAV